MGRELCDPSEDRKAGVGGFRLRFVESGSQLVPPPPSPAAQGPTVEDGSTSPSLGQSSSSAVAPRRQDRIRYAWLLFLSLLRLDFRRQFLRETKRFSRSRPQLLGSFLSAKHPTDPLMVETSQDYIKEEQLDEKLYCSRVYRNWNSFSDFLVLVITASLGSATYSIFPWKTIETNTGLLFLIPVLVGWIILALPLMLFEQTLGHIFKGPPFKVFAMIHPRLIGLGFSFITMLVFTAPSELVYASQALGYFFESMSHTLPWAVSAANVEECQLYPIPDACEASAICLPSRDFGSCLPSTLKIGLNFYSRLATGSTQFTEAPTFHSESFLCVMLTLLMALLLLYYGPTLMGPLASFAVVASVLILGLLLLSENSAVKANVESTAALHDFVDSSKWKLLFESPDIWLKGIIVALYASFVARGHNYVLSSCLPLRCNLVFTGTCVMILQTYASVVSSVILSRTLYSATDQLTVLLESRIALDFLSHGLCFLLFPVALAKLPGAPLFSMLFFLTIWMQSLIRITILAMGVILTLTESRSFRRCRSVYFCFLVLLFFLAATIPYLLNFGSSPEEAYEGLGLIRTVANERVLIYFTVPVVALITLICVDVAIGSRALSFYLGWAGPGTRASILAIFYATFLILLFIKPELSALHFIFATMLGVLLIVFVVAAALGPLHRRRYATLLYAWTYGGLDAFRRLVSDTFCGKNKIFKVPPHVWAILLSTIVPWLLLSIIATGFNETGAIFVIIDDQNPPTWWIVAAALVFGIPTLVGAIFPSGLRFLLPPPTKCWTVDRMPRRRPRARVTLKRYRVWFWEEFLPVHRIWNNATKLTVEKVR